MSRLLDIQPQDALTIFVSGIIGAGALYNSLKFGKRILAERIPKKWRKVGELSELFVFPVKSCGPILMNEIDCVNTGLKLGHLRDRIFVVTKSTGEYITAATYPKMVRVIPKIEKDKLTLDAPNMKEILIDITKLYELKASVNIQTWGGDAKCIDCGDEVARWFSKFILGEYEGLRLLFYPSSDPKSVVNTNKKYLFEQADQKDSGTLHGETSFMLMNQSSFDDLNTKIEKKVLPLQYRPNFVVKGPAAWEEDSWKWIKIGNSTIFRNVQPCVRCVITNVDPLTGERTPQMEPLKTLKTFRLFEKISTHEPVFGIHLGVRKMGSVKLGDAVYVGY